MTALGLPGFFDRNFLTSPAAVQVSEEDGARNIEPDPSFFDGQSPEGSTSSCVSASPFSVEIVARAQSIGGLVAITSGPGEMFSNSTNTIEEQADRRGAVALAVAAVTVVQGSSGIPAGGALWSSLAGVAVGETALRILSRIGQAG